MLLHSLGAAAIVAFVLGVTGAASHHAYALSYAPSVNVIELGLFDPSSPEPIKFFELELGQQFVLRSTIQNNLDAAQPFLIYSEIRDAAGVTIYLAWQSGTLKANGNYTMEATWIPDTICWIDYPGCNQYEVRSFVVTGIESPQVLSAVKTSGGITVVETNFHGNRIYQILLNGEEYEIEYAMEYGFISHMTAHVELATVIMQVQRVTNDTELELVVPQGMMADIFSCERDSSLSEPQCDIVAFVDHVPVDVTLLDWQEEGATLQLSLPAGSEQVELAGTIIP